MEQNVYKYGKRNRGRYQATKGIKNLLARTWNLASMAYTARGIERNLNKNLTATKIEWDRPYPQTKTAGPCFAYLVAVAEQLLQSGEEHWRRKLNKTWSIPVTKGATMHMSTSLWQERVWTIELRWRINVETQPKYQKGAVVNANDAWSELALRY